MFLLIDNFDSFTFNLVQAFYGLGKNPTVIRNDRPELLDLATSGDLEMVCLSPGPSWPVNAGLCLEFLARLPKTVPVLGVCLGHQTLGHFAGCEIYVGPRIMHGKTSEIQHNGQGMFKGIENPVTIGRYHSLLVRAEDSDLIEVTAWTEHNGEREVMGLRYTDRPWVGVQFHPESVLTPQGAKMLANFPEAIL